jgi:hypothetical protein
MRSLDVAGFDLFTLSGFVLDVLLWALAACAPLRAIATARPVAHHDELTLFDINPYSCGAPLKGRDNCHYPKVQ